MTKLELFGLWRISFDSLGSPHPLFQAVQILVFNIPKRFFHQILPCFDHQKLLGLVWQSQKSTFLVLLPSNVKFLGGFQLFCAAG